MLDQGGHHFVGDDIGVDLEFEFFQGRLYLLGQGFELDGAGLVLKAQDVGAAVASEIICVEQIGCPFGRVGLHTGIVLFCAGVRNLQKLAFWSFQLVIRDHAHQPHS